MVVGFRVKGSRTSEYLFLPEQLEIHLELNGRRETPDIEPLIQSIVAYGQLQPVTIRRSAGMPVLVAGFSRWRAVSEINKRNLLEKPIELRCSYTQLTDKQAFLANIEENRVRNGTTPMDDAYNIQRLINAHQMTEQECADAYRTSVAWVKSRLSLIEATLEVEKQIRAGKIKGSAAATIAKLSKEDQKNLAKVAETNGKVTAGDIRKEVGEPARKPEKAVAPPPKGGNDLSKLAVELATHVIADDLVFEKMEALANKVLAAAGFTNVNNMVKQREAAIKVRDSADSEVKKLVDAALLAVGWPESD